MVRSVAFVALAAAAALWACGCGSPGNDKAREPAAPKPYEEDVFPTSAGEVRLAFLGHGTLMFSFGDRVFHVDPVSGEADYAKLPKGDVILVTHEHGDHLDAKAIAAARKEGTIVLYPEVCAASGVQGTVMRNGESRTEAGVTIEAIPAYNLAHKRPNGDPFHPKGAGNGYLLSFGGLRVYVGGDTENTPEVKALRGIDVAFLPMNLPYTMTPEMVADAAKAFRPKVLYPYHFGKTDPNELVKLLASEKDVEVRIRKLE